MLPGRPSGTVTDFSRLRLAYGLPNPSASILTLERPASGMLWSMKAAVGIGLGGQLVGQVGGEENDVLM